VLDQRDLPAALAEVGRQMGGAKVEVRTEGDARPLADRAVHALLRCAQEAMTNAVNHGSATQFAVLLRFEAGHVGLRVEDNGCGFDPALAPGMEEGHFGLQGMRERVKRLEGEFALASRPGGGTRIDIRIPAAAKGGVLS
jgi:signal transduction histidine kinase